MRSLIRMIGMKRIVKIGHEELRARAGLANISEKLRVARQIWLGHMERKTEEDELANYLLHRKGNAKTWH